MGLAPSQRGALAVVRYLLFEEIGAGGMATVHLGLQHGSAGLARTVAIKRLYPQFVRDPELTAMLLDEARLAARIRHPNVVSTIDMVSSGGELLLVMEYVHGEPLARLLRAATRDGGAPPPRVACAVLAGALHGLHAAHEATGEDGAPLGLVHRDVSPHNLLVGVDGVARVLDFGVAKAAGRAHVTRDGQIKGKLAYMPPEQLAGDPLDRRADVYAAGVVLWETLTGERLFEGRGGEALSILRLAQAGVEPPSARRPGLPPALEEITLRALSRDPADRFPTARAMALALEATGLAASTSEVGAWVSSIAGEALAQRAALIAAIERGVAPRAPAGVAPALPGSPPHTPTPATLTAPVVQVPLGSPVEPGVPALPPSSPGARQGERRRRWAAVAAAGGLLAITAAAASFARAEARRPDRAAVGVSSVASRAAAARRIAPPDPAPAGPPASATGAEASASAPGSARAPRAPDTGAPPAKPRRPAGARPSCDPPFSIDAQGHKRYKRECF
jgi:serine/threonine-protein kinase